MKSSGMGGQAVLEGVMMRNGGKYAVAVRKPDNDIDVLLGDFKSISERNRFFNFPFVRGIVRFVEEAYLGLKNFSAAGEYYSKDEDSPKSGNSSGALQLLIVIAIISLTIGMFVALPYGISFGVSKLVTSDTVLTLIEGAIRLILLIIYAIGISMLPDVKRLYMYVGATHKVINCMDKGLPLTVSNVRRMSRKNYKCGMLFVINVIFISAVLFMFIRFESIPFRIVFRLLLLPVVAGFTYEVMRIVSKRNNPVAAILNIPGMIVHSLTTDEPADDMIEVAIESALAVCGNDKVIEHPEKKEIEETDKKQKKLKSGIKRVSKEKLAKTKKEEKTVKNKEQNNVKAVAKDAVDKNKENKKVSSKQLSEEDDDEILNALNHFFNSKKEEDKRNRDKRK